MTIRDVFLFLALVVCLSLPAFGQDGDETLTKRDAAPIQYGAPQTAPAKATPNAINNSASTPSVDYVNTQAKKVPEMESRIARLERQGHGHSREAIRLRTEVVKVRQLRTVVVNRPRTIIIHSGLSAKNFVTQAQFEAYQRSQSVAFANVASIDHKRYGGVKSEADQALRTAKSAKGMSTQTARDIKVLFPDGVVPIKIGETTMSTAPQGATTSTSTPTGKGINVMHTSSNFAGLPDWAIHAGGTILFLAIAAGIVLLVMAAARGHQQRISAREMRDYSRATTDHIGQVARELRNLPQGTDFDGDGVIDTDGGRVDGHFRFRVGGQIS